jgi:tetratricopeptide (TPR) repeat protein
MNLELLENLASRGVKGDFKFTNPDSFRLFVEGIRELRLYERSAEPENLATANQKLESCVSQFPYDVLPQFYLGVVKTLQSYDGAGDAIRLFRSIAERRVPELRAAALYNLAGAHIELYTPEDFDRAEKALDECLAELRNPRSVEHKALRLQARVLLLFCKVRQQLWVKRREPVDGLRTELDVIAPKLQAELESLRREAEEASIPSEAQADVLADHWNTRGILEEFLATTSADMRKRDEFTKASVQSFNKALDWKLNWIPAKSNLARVYQDLAEKPDEAVKLWQEVLEARPGDNYTEYMLGRLYKRKGEYLEAASHYERSPNILVAQKDLARLYSDQLNRRDDAVRLWQEVLSKSPDDSAALEALSALGAPRPTRASDAKPTA